MSELTDFFVNVNRIADAMDRIAAAAEQIAAVHGMAQTEPAQTAPKTDGRKKKTPPPPAEAAQTPPATEAAQTPPPPAPETEDLFGDSTPDAPEITAEDVKSVLSQALKHMLKPDGTPDTAKVSALFKQHNGGADKVSNMKPEFYKPVYDAFQAVLENL